MKFLVLVVIFAGCVWVPPQEEADRSAPEESPVVVLRANMRQGVVGIDTFVLTSDQSFDRNNDDISFDWRLIAPSGVAVALQTDGDARTFVATEIGEYIATLTGTDETGRRSTQSLAIQVYNSSPQPSLKSCSPGLQHLFYDTQDLLIEGDLDFVCIDLTDSYDVDGHEVNIVWSLDTVPPEAAELILDGDGPIARFRLPVDGVYEGQFLLTDGFGGEHEMRFTLHRILRQ